MPELLRAGKLAVDKGQAQGRDESYIKQLSEYIISSLVEALNKVRPLDKTFNSSFGLSSLSAAHDQHSFSFLKYKYYLSILILLVLTEPVWFASNQKQRSLWTC